MKKSGFTLAEVLITLAIIGVVAAMTIPSVIVNTNQQEFKTGLRKAVSVLNSSITMNMALEGESPHDNSDLFNYLQQHMSVIKSTTNFPYSSNKAFYTTDGMRFEFGGGRASYATLKLHESNETICFGPACGGPDYPNGNCGSRGLNVGNYKDRYPCLILVDVNGDRKPNPRVESSIWNPDNPENWYKPYTYAQPNDKLLKDVFLIMITDDKAVPFGVVAQKAMYQARR